MKNTALHRCLYRMYLNPALLVQRKIAWKSYIIFRTDGLSGFCAEKIKVVLNRISGSGIGLRIIVFERIQIMLARLAASRHKAWELKSININENSRHCGYRILRYLEDEKRFVFIILCVFKSFVSSWTVIINPLANVFYRFQRHGCV